MFSIGDMIIYGSEGVYTVTEYTTSPIDKTDTRQFYVLLPVHGPASNIIITPITNDKIQMRNVMSRDEAIGLIEKMPSIPALDVEKEKNRRDVYRKALDNATAEMLVSIIKTVMERRYALAKVKKRVSESDNDYEKKAKNCLYGELAVALDIQFDEVDVFIENILNVKSE